MTPSTTIISQLLLAKPDKAVVEKALRDLLNQVWREGYAAGVKAKPTIKPT